MSRLAVLFPIVLSACIVVPARERFLADSLPVTVWPARAACPLPARSAADARALLALINGARAGAGVGPLALSEGLSMTAQRHACDNAAGQTVSHVGSDGAALVERLHRDGIKVLLAAENTGLGFSAPQMAFDWWMASTQHRANILRAEVSEIGIGRADGVPRGTWVLDFIQPR